MKRSGGIPRGGSKKPHPIAKIWTFTAGDLDAFAGRLAEQRTRQRRQRATPCLAPAPLRLHRQCGKSGCGRLAGDGRAELDPAVVGRRLDQLRARPPRAPVAQLARRRGDGGLVAGADRSRMRRMVARDFAVDGGEPRRCDQIWMARHRPIGHSTASALSSLTKARLMVVGVFYGSLLASTRRRGCGALFVCGSAAGATTGGQIAQQSR